MIENITLAGYKKYIAENYHDNIDCSDEPSILYSLERSNIKISEWIKTYNSCSDFCENCNFICGNCTDVILENAVYMMAYDLLINSPQMGDSVVDYNEFLSKSYFYLLNNGCINS